MTQTNNDYIMLPTVDFCFKELMQNPKVRQGFIAALLRVNPKEISETSLLPTILSRDNADDKLGILDVRVKLVNGTQIDMEMQVATFEAWQNRILFYLCKMYTEQIKKGDGYEVLKKCIHVSILNFDHFPDDETCCRTINMRDNETGELYSDLLEIQILELNKLPKELPEDDDIISWMRFFSGKKKEDFQKMADTNEYIGEAYDTLVKLSADEKKRLEYEAREKAIRDYNAGMNYAQKMGLEQGEEKRNRDLIYKWTDKNVPVSEIADRLEWTEEEVRKVQAERNQN